MEYRKPAYYDYFRCLADKCPATCCSGWQIVIDEKTLEDYKNNTAVYGKQIMEGVDFEEGVFKRCGERCHFLTEQNLCRLYELAQGPDLFCKTCSRYPRHFEVYGNLAEASLSMSCPEAARLIVTGKDAPRYQTRQRDIRSPYEKEVDGHLAEALIEVRKRIFYRIEKADSMKKAMWQILSYGEELQPVLFQKQKYPLKYKLPGRETKFWEGFLDIKENTRVPGYLNSESLLSRRSNAMKQYFGLLLGLENINSEWPTLVRDTMEILYEERKEQEYTDCVKAFETYEEAHLRELKNILHYFLYTYFMGGVYDYNILAMIRLSVMSLVFIREMAMAKWISNGKRLSEEELLKICYQYSRQVEHSDDNLLALEGIMTAHPAFTMENMEKVL